MRIVSLISAVNQNIEELIAGMQLETDAVLVNQCGLDDSGKVEISGHQISWLNSSKRGVGLSRNACIDMVDNADICLFTDEDIIYDEGYAALIEKEYEEHPEAEAILFNMRVCENRRTYWNEDYSKINFTNYGRYPAYSISIRKSILEKSGVRFPLEFGGGAKYINGEDSVFLHDLLAKKVRIYRSPVCLGMEQERESTWFSGYNDNFFVSRGALYVRLYGVWAYSRAILFLVRHKYMYAEMGFGKSLNLMKQGMREIRGSK